MSRLIDADTLKKAINDNGCRHSHYFDIFDVIDNATTVEQPTGKREFIKIVSRYIHDEICPYEEYKGKPYYSILYRENGKEFEGYGTYSLDVLSDFLKCYFFGNGEEVVGNGIYNLDTSSEREETKMEERVKGGEGDEM